MFFFSEVMIDVSVVMVIGCLFRYLRYSGSDGLFIIYGYGK